MVDSHAHSACHALMLSALAVENIVAAGVQDVQNRRNGKKVTAGQPE